MGFGKQIPLTECPLLGAGEALVELPVFSCFRFALGLEKDLNMSDCSLLTGAGVLAGLPSRSRGRLAWISRTVTAWGVDLADLSLGEGRSEDLIAVSCSLWPPWLLLLAFSLRISARDGCASTGNRLPVLRYKRHRQVPERFQGKPGPTLTPAL